MFTEILRVKPVLDQGTAKKMEMDLSRRFTRVASKFGKGLKNIVKGNILFMSLGLLTQLLNPLEKIEERIKSLLGQGSDLRDIADQFDTSPGKIKRLQDVAQNIGLSPDQLKDMMTRFSETMDKTRQEFKAKEKDPKAEISNSSRMLKEFMGEKDTAEAFLSFVQSLNAAGGDTREKVEREIFGGVQKGASRRFIEADFAKEFSTLKTPSVKRTDLAVEKAAKLAEKDRRMTTSREGSSFVEGLESLTGKMITDMNKAKEREKERDQAQMKAVDDLAKAKEGIDNLVAGFQVLSVQVTKGVGYLGELISTLKNSRFIKGIGSWFSGDK
jgi:hypothetical protein